VTPTRQQTGTGRALVLQHHPLEDAGSLGPLLADAGLSLTVVELDAGGAIAPLEPFDLLLVMGGPMDVWEEHEHPWLVEEMSAIRYWVAELERPFLGVCLGHQLLAKALGGTVGPMAEPEIGVIDIELTDDGLADPLFADVGSPFGASSTVVPALQWHGAEVTEPPPGGVTLARTAECAVQAIRVGDHAWGVQFHVEAGPATVPLWATVPEYERTLAAHFGSATVLEADVARHRAAMDATARALVQGLLGSVLSAGARR
jgi:GMP synthase-like glutamine amidotransferase